MWYNVTAYKKDRLNREKRSYFLKKMIVIQDVICNFATQIQNDSLKISEQSGFKTVIGIQSDISC